MYGSIFRMKVKSGHEKSVIAVWKEWDTSRQSQVSGVVATFLLKPDKGTGEKVGVAVFEDKASYEANADDRAQDKWYRELRENLEADPAWEDGEYVAGAVS